MNYEEYILELAQEIHRFYTIAQEVIPQALMTEVAAVWGDLGEERQAFFLKMARETAPRIHYERRRQKLDTLQGMLTDIAETLQEEGVKSWGDGGKLGDMLLAIKDVLEEKEAKS
ncbi:MAG: hypothetical protein J2P36_04960 [Ktedonobacteraceae bacterium]|nr:hypothetical protein [Ktedonobacteraceae bacterium]